MLYGAYNMPVRAGPWAKGLVVQEIAMWIDGRVGPGCNEVGHMTVEVRQIYHMDILNLRYTVRTAMNAKWFNKH